MLSAALVSECGFKDCPPKLAAILGQFLTTLQIARVATDYDKIQGGATWAILVHFGRLMCAKLA